MEKAILKAEALTGRRIGAFIVDLYIVSIITIIPSMLLFNNVNVMENIWDFACSTAITSLIAYILFLFKDIFAGRSIGKLLFGLYVREYHNKDNKPKYYRLIQRNLLTIIWPVEFIVLLKDKEGRRLGDKIAKTQVVGLQRNKKKVSAGKVIAIVFFVLTVLIISIILIIKNDESFKIAVDYIKRQEAITAEVGEIRDCGTLLSGSLSYSSVPNGSGHAVYYILVIGEKKNLIVSIELYKDEGSYWGVKEIDF